MVRAELEAGNFDLFINPFNRVNVPPALAQLDIFINDANAREGRTVANGGFPDGFSGRSVRTVNFGLFLDEQLDALQHHYDYRPGVAIREEPAVWANL